MPSVTFNFPTQADLDTTVNALSVKFGYQPTLPDGTPNLQSKAEFVRQLGITWYRNQVREHLLNTAKAAVTVTDVSIT